MFEEKPFTATHLECFLDLTF